MDDRVALLLLLVPLLAFGQPVADDVHDEGDPHAEGTGQGSEDQAVDEEVGPVLPPPLGGVQPEQERGAQPLATYLDRLDELRVEIHGHSRCPLPPVCTGLVLARHTPGAVTSLIIPAFLQGRKRDRRTVHGEFYPSDPVDRTSPGQKDGVIGPTGCGTQRTSGTQTADHRSETEPPRG
ncbi:hypothetical protein ACFFX0_11770 [Citricoccus parietis]|uniref:Uncharacterized protein n=1 Tax=Citricoccus parietis TaxID=592307 RepID=A0ABV5FYS2_9MICC